MLNATNERQELDLVNMFIRALSDEVAQQRAHNGQSESESAVAVEIEEALYELRLRKLLISAMVNSDQTVDSTMSH
ncbi:MAG: hypothetical protein WAV20_18865 [Blastocatellia bacterium]